MNHSTRKILPPKIFVIEEGCGRGRVCPGRRYIKTVVAARFLMIVAPLFEELLFARAPAIGLVEYQRRGVHRRRDNRHAQMHPSPFFIALEQGAAIVQHLEKHHSQRPDVGAFGKLLPVILGDPQRFGGGILERPRISTHRQVGTAYEKYVGQMILKK